MIDKEGFDEWLAHPVTEYVFRHFAALSDDRKERWIEISWGNGNSDPIDLKVLRETSALLRQMSELRYEDLENEDETKPAIATRR